MSTQDIQDDTNAFLREIAEAPATHPRCTECAIPMWLVVIEQTDRQQRMHYQCKACDAKFIQLTDGPQDTSDNREAANGQAARRTFPGTVP